MPLLFPVSVTAAGLTDIYVGYIGKNNNYTTVTEAVTACSLINPTSNDGSNMLYLQNGNNVTIEGIGYNTHLVRWGFEIKRSSSIEVRNLYFYQYLDDAIGLNGDSSNMTNHIWIHNNSFGAGKNEFAGNGTIDSDKSKGDGTTDMKWSEYVTVSYNYYNGCHKTSLVGGSASHDQDWITYHHNWFDGTSSRNPRARKAHVHIFNNYFCNNSSYGIGASYNSKIFSESNYFESVNLPLDTEAMGSDAYSGTIKSFNDKLVNCTGNSIYTAVNSRADNAYIPNLVNGGESYDNFDTDLSKIYLDRYTPQTPDDAKATILEYAGRMQNKVYVNGTVNPNNPDVVPEDDLNSDNAIDIYDLIIMRSVVIGENVDYNVVKAGDFDKNGSTDEYDLVKMRDFILKR